MNLLHRFRAFPAPSEVFGKTRNYTYLYKNPPLVRGGSVNKGWFLKLISPDVSKSQLSQLSFVSSESLLILTT